MARYCRLFSLLGFLLAVSIHVWGQGFGVIAGEPLSLTKASPDSPFVSTSGRYSIALPQQISEFGPVSQQTPKGKITGDAFSWVTKEANFKVSYGDYAAPLGQEEIAGLLGQLQDALVKAVTAKQGKIFSTKLRPLAGGVQGLEVVLEQGDSKGILRALIIGRRFYQLLATMPKQKTQGETAVLKALDSFRVLSPEQVQAILKKKLVEATPASLPQEPVAAKQKSDAEDEGLKGRIKIIESEDQDLTGTWTVQGRKPANTEHYDQRGNLTKRESWDYQGNPSDVTVYGYLDGARVSKSGHISYEYNPPPAMAPPPAPGKAAAKRDLRYDFKYTYKYDDTGRLVERNMFHNDGKPWQKYTSTYEKQQQENRYYSNDGKLNARSIEKLNDKGLVIEYESWDVTTNKVRDRMTYEYELDTQGNWTKRTTLTWQTKEGKSGFVPSYTTWRKITYYE